MKIIFSIINLILNLTLLIIVSDISVARSISQPPVSHFKLCNRSLDIKNTLLRVRNRNEIRLLKSISDFLYLNVDLKNLSIDADFLFESDRLQLRPIRKEHEQNLLQHLLSPLAASYYWLEETPTISYIEKLIYSIKSKPIFDHLPYGQLFKIHSALYFKDSNELAGIITLKMGDRITKAISFDYFIFPEYQNLGLATEIIGSLLQALKSIGPNHYWAYALVNKENTPSIRVLSKNGFRFYTELIENPQYHYYSITLN